LNVKIITDSISDISQDVADMYDIEVLPIDFLIGETYVSAKNLDVNEMVSWIKDNKSTPAIKGVSTEAYTKAFEKHINKGMEIICFTAGSTIVSNYDCACHASTRFPNANIHIIDTHQLSTSIGIMAIKAAEMAKNNESANAIAIRFERSMDKFKQYGLADSVEFLQYSGYCPRIVSIGNVLNYKYEFAVYENQSFDVKKVGNTMDKAMASYFRDIFRDIHSIDPKRIFMVHTYSDEDYFAELYRRVLGLDYFEEIIVCNASHHTTSLYGGSGISVAYQLK